MARHAPLLASGASLPEAIQRTRFRSQLELKFALQLEARGLRWFYEPERICKYLIDFYLPDGKLWVEVKGRVTSRDHRLLREAAAELRAQRGHRLFLWTSQRAYQVGGVDFAPLSHDQFWAMFAPPPDSPTADATR